MQWWTNKQICKDNSIQNSFHILKLEGPSMVELLLFLLLLKSAMNWYSKVHSLQLCNKKLIRFNIKTTWCSLHSNNNSNNPIYWACKVSNSQCIIFLNSMISLNNNWHSFKNYRKNMMDQKAKMAEQHLDYHQVKHLILHKELDQHKGQSNWRNRQS